MEARVPSLDREFLDFSLNEVNPEDKMCGITKDGLAEIVSERK